MKNKNEIKSGIVLSYVYMAIAMIAGLLYTPKMLSMMGESEYGLYSLASSIITYLSFLGLGLESALVRYTAKYIALDDKKSERKLCGMFLMIYLIISAVTIICGTVLSFNLGFLSKKLTVAEAKKLRVLVLVLTGNLAFSFPMGVYGAVITAHEKFNFRKVVSIIREVLMPFVILACLYLGYRSIGLVIVHTAFNVVTLVSDFVYVKTVIKIKPIFGKPDFKLLKEIAGYTVFIFIGTIVDRISDSTNNMVLAAVSGTAAVAVFNIAMQIYGYYLNFSSSISSFFFPRVVGMTFQESSNDEMSDLFIKVGRIQFYVISLICSGFIIFGKQFITLWAGEEYKAAYYIVIIAMVPTLINRSQSLGTQILQAKNKHQFRAILFLGITLLDIAISIPLAKLWEGVGAAAGTAIATLIGPIIIMNIYYHKVIGLNIPKYWKNAVPMLLMFVITTFLGMIMCYFWKTTGWIVLIIQAILYVILYFLVMYFIVFDKYEKDLLLNII